MSSLYKKLVPTMLGTIAGYAMANGLNRKEIKDRDKKVDKFKGYYNILNEWLSIKLRGDSLSVYFEQKNIKVIAIYGMGELGKRLYEELINSDVIIKYAIDKNVVDKSCELLLVHPESELKPVDAIVVTSVFAFDEIEADLMKKTEAEIISLEDVVYMCN